MKSHFISRSAVVAFSLGAALSVLIPFHIHPLRSFWNDFVAFYALFGALLLLLFSGVKTWKWTGLSLLPIALTGLLTIQCVFIDGIFGWDLVLPALYFLALPFAFGFGATISSSDQEFSFFARIISYAFVISAFCSVGIQITQIAGIRFSPWMMAMPVSGWNIRPYANLGQPNQLALWIAFGLSGTWYLFQSKKFSGASAILIAMFLVFGIALTQSRIGWIILPVMFFLFFVFSNLDRKAARLSAIFILMFYFFCVFGLPVLLSYFSQENASGVVARIGGRSERLGLYLHALAMLREHPFLGVGWGQFGEHQVMIASQFPATTYSEHAHNIVFQFVAELGLVPTCMILGILGYWSFKVFIEAKKSDGLMFVFACLMAVGVHSMVEFPLWYAYVLIPVTVLMGAAHSNIWQCSEFKISRVSGIAVSLVVIICSVFLVNDHSNVVAGFNQLRNVGSERLKTPSIVEQPTLTVLPYFYRYFEMMRIEPMESMTPSDIRFLEHWSLRFGFVHIINKLAEVHALNGMEDAAVKDMVTLQKLHPERYAEYYDYWYAKGLSDPKYAKVVAKIPGRSAL